MTWTDLLKARNDELARTTVQLVATVSTCPGFTDKLPEEVYDIHKERAKEIFIQDDLSAAP